MSPPLDISIDKVHDQKKEKRIKRKVWKAQNYFRIINPASQKKFDFFPLGILFLFFSLVALVFLVVSILFQFPYVKILLIQFIGTFLLAVFFFILWFRQKPKKEKLARADIPPKTYLSPKQYLIRFFILLGISLLSILTYFPFATNLWASIIAIPLIAIFLTVYILLIVSIIKYFKSKKLGG